MAGYDTENDDGRRLRNEEYLQVLQANINHPLIKKVILFYADDLSIKVSWSSNHL